MDEMRKKRIVIFEDDKNQLSALSRELETAFASLEGGVELLTSWRADQKPSIDGNSEAALDREDLIKADAIVVDLGMELRFPHPDVSIRECAICENSYGGVHVLRNAKAWDSLDKVFINSAYLEGMRTSGTGIHEEIEALINDGVSVFDKNSPRTPDRGNYQNLSDKIYSLLNLRRLGYSADASTRDNLYLVARRSISERMEPVLILGKTGTGKEQAAGHIHRLGQRFLINEGKQRSMCELAVVHCGGLTAELARDELFGHVKDAFTGASGHKIGRVLRAIGCNAGASAREKGLKDKVEEAAKSLKEFSQNSRFRASNLQADHVSTEDKLAQLEGAAEDLLKLVNDHWGNIGKLLGYLAGSKERLSSEQYRDWLLHRNGNLLERKKKKHELEDVNELELQVKTNAPFGTVFLDEFGELHPSVQALLLRFLENGEIQPLGYEGIISLKDKEDNLHIRFIGATNRKELRDLLATTPPLDLTNETQDPPSPVMSLGFDETSVPASSVRADLVYRLAQWIVELPDLQSGEVEYLIEVEKNIRPSLKQVSWDNDALKKLKSMVDNGRFPGQRRQLRTVAMRAMAYASELPALGISTQFQRSSLVTENLLTRAAQPIRIEPVKSRVEVDRLNKLRRAISTWLNKENLWPNCPERLTWQAVQDHFDRNKPEIGKLFLLSSLFHEPAEREYGLEELENAWGAETHNKIRSYLKDDREAALNQALKELNKSAAQWNSWTGALKLVREDSERWAL